MRKTTFSIKKCTKRSSEDQEGSSTDLKKKRNQNWSTDEKAALVNAITEHYDKLIGKFSATVSSNIKHTLWGKVADAVNALGTSRRSVADIKLKWTDLRSRTKQKASAQLKALTKTGGGEAEEMSMSLIEDKLTLLSTMEKSIVKLGGKQWLFGIDGGLDTALMKGTGPIASEAIPSSSRALVPATFVEREVDNSMDGDWLAKLIDEPAPLPRLEPQPKISKKRIRREASEVSVELLEVERQNSTNLGRIADSLEELVRLKKVELGLNV